MRKLINVPFSVDPIQTALDNLRDGTILVFPTRTAAKSANRRFITNWDLRNCRFISMADFRDELFPHPEPVVQDDLRLLCLFQAFMEADRDFFHIGDYFDLVEWGRKFFQFFEEICDECVDLSVLEDPFGSRGINLLGWQDTYLQRVLQIHGRYRDLLLSQGLTDPIFFQKPGAISVPYRARLYIFVNQYYYSNLEKQLLHAVEQAGNDLLIISQVAGGPVDPESLESHEINLHALVPDSIRTTGIRIMECENPDQMAIAFIREQSGSRIPSGVSAVLIDNQFHQRSYSRLFGKDRFEFGQHRSFVHTGIYGFLQSLGKHLEAMNSSIGGRFLPLRLILDDFGRESFVRYYWPDICSRAHTQLLDEIKDLINSDILYVDSGLHLFMELARSREYDLLPGVLAPHFALLAKLAEADSPEILAGLFDAPGGIAVRSMCSEAELQYSNVLDRFYSCLAEFHNLNSLRAVSSWKGLFQCEPPLLAAKLLRLLLESLARASYNLNVNSTRPPNAISVNNLLDLRGLRYDHTFVFHAIEGVYPSNPSPVWLFNENQRAMLGLKSYDDLRRRERYYFLSQILSSKDVTIYTYRDLEKDIEPGSFVTEILHAAENNGLAGIVPVLQTARPRLASLYRKPGVVKSAMTDPDRGLDRAAPDSFFVIPSVPEADLGSARSLKVSYQSLSQLEKNPFAWYLRHHCKLNQVELRQEETISRKLFGALLHDYISAVLGPLEGSHRGTDRLAAALDDMSLLREQLSRLISSSIYLYKLPQNYNHDFLAGVIFDCLAASVRQFFRDFLHPLLRGKEFELLPEHERMTHEEKRYKTLLSLIHDGSEYKLDIRGIADLRVETASQNIIVDFKTRGLDIDQLYFYEWFYYLLDPAFDGKELFSRFWMILDQTADNSKKTDDAKRRAWREEIGGLLSECLSGGYPLGKTVQNRQQMKQITRADLYRPAGGDT